MDRGEARPAADQMRRMLDLFCGRWGWSRAFAARGWECVGVDLIEPSDVPTGCIFVQQDVLGMSRIPDDFEFICASSPCQEFALFGMPHFWPNPPYPELGIRLFNHTRALLWRSGRPLVMENVRAAQRFVGNATMACGPFMLWGTGVPPLMPQGVNKGMSQQRDASGRRRGELEHVSKKERAARGAQIPSELANTVVDYAERLLEQRGISA